MKNVEHHFGTTSSRILCFRTLNPQQPLQPEFYKKNEKRLLKLKRKPYNSAAIAPVRVVKENSQKIIKSSLVSGHF